MRRVSEVAWVADHLHNLESDFSAFHRIDFDADVEDFDGLSSAKFFRLAERIFAYPGVMQALMVSEQEKRRSRLGTDKVIDLTPEMVAAGQGPGLEGLIEWGHG